MATLGLLGTTEQCARNLERRLSALAECPVRLVISSRAKRLLMQVEPNTRGVRVTIPVGARESDASAFVESHRGWIHAALRRTPERIKFVVGGKLMVLGVPRRVTQDERTRFRAFLRDGEDGPEIRVGKTDFVERHVTDLLRDLAHAEMGALSRIKATSIGKAVRSVRIGDFASQWGSCSASSDLTYSWRMVLAPLEILDYLVAHEVAHLVELNHSVRFWRLCKSLSGISPAKARSWLRVNATRLLLYGAA